jgi:hypothetical protein
MVLALEPERNWEIFCAGSYPWTHAYPGVNNAIDPLLIQHGLLARLDPIDDHQRFQLDAAAIIWRASDGTPPSRPIYTRRAVADSYTQTLAPVNAYFQRFYRETAAELSRLEAREHTAQVVAPGERERRERVSVGMKMISAGK